VAAPLVAFQLVNRLEPQLLGWISAGLIVIGSAFLFPEIPFGKSGRPGAALVEEVSD